MKTIVFENFRNIESCSESTYVNRRTPLRPVYDKSTLNTRSFIIQHYTYALTELIFNCFTSILIRVSATKCCLYWISSLHSNRGSDQQNYDVTYAIELNCTLEKLWKVHVVFIFALLIDTLWFYILTTNTSIIFYIYEHLPEYKPENKKLFTITNFAEKYEIF